jgi:hypothetical protein
MRVWSVSVCHLIASAQRGAIYVLNRHPRLPTSPGPARAAAGPGARSSQASVVKPHTVKCVSSALETGVSRTVESRSRALYSLVSTTTYTLFSCKVYAKCRRHRVCAPRARSLKLYRLCDRSLCLSVSPLSPLWLASRRHRSGSPADGPNPAGAPAPPVSISRRLKRESET